MELLPVRPKLKPKNRKEKRDLMSEVKRNIPKLFEIEQNFLDFIFNEEEADYDQAYDKYLEQYNKRIVWMQKQRMFHLTYPHPYYFPLKYKGETQYDLDPISYFFSKIRELF